MRLVMIEGYAIDADDVRYIVPCNIGCFVSKIVFKSGGDLLSYVHVEDIVGLLKVGQV